MQTDTSLDHAGLVRLVRAQRRLVQAVQELSLVRTVPAIQEVVRRAARELVGADGATFVLREGDQCHYADEDAISPLWKGQRFPMAACISGWVMLNAQPVVIPDIYADARVPADAYRPTFVKSLAMVPIRVPSPVGAIGVYWAHSRPVSEAELGLLQALASTTSVAMENVQVYTELERRVVTRTQQLESLNQELEAFSYSVSHDLRAPLRAVNGFSALLADELGPECPEKARRYLQTVIRSGARMSQLIDDLMRLSQVVRKELRTIDVDLASLAREITNRLRHENPQREVDVVIPDQLVARCDAGLMAVVLENLFSNAWKFTGKRPRARIELGVRRQADGTPVVFVEDNGVGFDPNAAQNLFAPFQRMHAESEFSGTGIGLATVQRVIHRHGGRIWAEARPGEGATFSFTMAGGASN